MQNPRDFQENDAEDEDETNNDLAGNASGNIPDDYYEELNADSADSGTDNNDTDEAEQEAPLSGYEGLDDDDDFMDDDE
ncbi:MAG: hypothetical protein JWQ28_1521 [Pedobacter sp.]|nr:hypothetical protein [Pedobacter sp.]